MAFIIMTLNTEDDTMKYIMWDSYLGTFTAHFLVWVPQLLHD